MSSDYYFRKWRNTLQRLEELIQLDQEFQRCKVHDKKRCDAVIRLCGMLGEYIVIYNDAFDYWQQNLQVQKTKYMFEVIKAITNRILELKHDIRKLEHSDTQFLSHGLAHHKLTTYDAELYDVPNQIKRPAHIDAAIAEAFRKAEEKRYLIKMEEENNEEETIKEKNWWDEDDSAEDETSPEIEEKQETKEMKQTRQMAALIQAHTRSWRTIQWLTQNHQRREKWKKELNGTLNPPARLELRDRGAKIIQKTLRAFFEIKRRKIIECKREEVLGMRLCRKPKNDATIAAYEINKRRDYREKFEHEWMGFKEKLREDYKTRKLGDITDDYREFINGWFKKWFDDIKYFYDLPKEVDGGSVLIMKEEVPDPIEWWENYQLYLEEKRSNKNKSAQQLKYENQETKREEQMRKKEELMKKKLEEQLAKRLMKNPNMLPGFNYPESKRTDQILKAIRQYRKDWEDLDHSDALEVKKKFVPAVDIEEIYAEIKKELMPSVDDEMRNKLKILKKALKNDYQNNEEPYPDPMKTNKKRAKKHRKRVKGKISENIAEKLEDLAFKDILKQYPETKLGDFLGDHNFAGDDMRCHYEPAPHFSGETRAFWWERCREATHGFHKILVVGPPLSAKTILVHALATVTDSVLFELDLSNLSRQSSNVADKSRLLNSLAACAKAAQPAVIYIKHIQRLFYKKTPPQEINMNLDQMKRLIKKMIKKFNKTDKITFIGTCVDPWVTKSHALLKEFPTVVLVPDTSYSAVFQILNRWISKNSFLPRDLDIHSLAFALRGYSYGYLEETLQNFLTAEEIIRIAARGLSTAEVYDYFLSKDTEKIDFGKYTKWYTEKTTWGKREAKHIAEQREFKRVAEMYAEKEKKKMALAASSAASIQSGSDDSESQ